MQQAQGLEAGAQPGAALTLKQIPGDITRKELIYDTRKELIKDPIWDTRKEIIGDQTWVENVFDPTGGLGIDPAVAAGGVPGGLQQQPQVGLEAGAAGLGPAAAKAIVNETLNTAAEQIGPVATLVTDRLTRKEIIFDTYKELIKDPIWDTRKEVFETYVEGGGTMQETPGGIDPGAVWNLPGMMF